MKSVFAQILVLTLLSTSMISCSGQSEADKASGETLVRLPWYSEEEGYGLQWVKLGGLDSLATVTGQYARFFFAPRVTKNHLEGLEPKARFIKTNKGFTPGNEVSQQMSVIYAHLERFAALDKELGAEGVNKWPRDVGVGVRIVGGVNNNAFYDGQTDSMLFVPYSASGMPIAVNAGILAHEHFHSLFHKLVIKPLEGTAAARLTSRSSVHNAKAFYKAVGIETPEEETTEKPVIPLIPPPRIDDFLPDSESDHRVGEYYHSVLIRGFNEGLADFWAWVYTGDPDFIALSLPRMRELRTMNATYIFYPREANLRYRVINALSTMSGESDSQLIGLAYEMGTQVSRTLKAFSDARAEAQGKDSREVRKDVARMIIKALPQMRMDLLKSVEAQTSYDPSAFLRAVVSSAGELSTAEKDVLNMATPGGF